MPGWQTGGSRNASLTVAAMMSKLSKLHKSIDEIGSLQQYADVRFKRHLSTAVSTNSRVARFTLAETAAVVAVAVLQVLVLRRFDLRVRGPHTWV